MSLQLLDHGIRIPFSGLMLPQQHDAWEKGEGSCVFSMPITGRHPLYHLERMIVTLASVEVSGKLGAARHVLTPRCRWHDDCLEHPELNEACVAARRGAWTRTRRVQRSFFRGYGASIATLNMGLWKPRFDPICEGDRLDLVFHARWNPRRVGPGLDDLARVMVELTVRPYQVAP